jgi:hypothetical protein
MKLLSCSKAGAPLGLFILMALTCSVQGEELVEIYALEDAAYRVEYLVPYANISARTNTWPTQMPFPVDIVACFESVRTHLAKSRKITDSLRLVECQLLRTRALVTKDGIVPLSHDHWIMVFKVSRKSETAEVSLRFPVVMLFDGTIALEKVVRGNVDLSSSTINIP